MFNTLLRMYECNEGDILFNGIDIKTLSITALRRAIVYAPLRFI